MLRLLHRLMIAALTVLALVLVIRTLDGLSGEWLEQVASSVLAEPVREPVLAFVGGVSEYVRDRPSVLGLLVLEVYLVSLLFRH